MGSTVGGYNEDPDLHFWAQDSNDIKDQLAKRVKRGSLWGWKDGLFLQYREQALPLHPANSRYVYVTRSPQLVTASMFRHKPYPKRTPDEMLVQNEVWQDDILMMMKTSPGFYVGDFDEFRQHPDGVITTLADWLPGDRSQIERAKRYIARNTYTDLSLTPLN
jgi:hypothetical protein